MSININNSSTDNKSQRIYITNYDHLITPPTPTTAQCEPDSVILNPIPTQRSLAELQRCILKLDPKNKRQFADRVKILKICREKNQGVNKVYTIRDETDRPITFFKSSAYSPTASAKMEKLVWKAGEILGFKLNLVKTKKLQLFFKDENEICGSLQPAIEGNTLIEHFRAYNFSLGPIKDRELYRAILTTYLIGTYDAHAGNIIVTPEGKIKLIDNAQSLPNANGLIASGDEGKSARSTYRCGLLDLADGVSQELTRQIKDELLDIARNCREQIGKLYDYLNSPSGEKLTTNLPYGWLDKASMLRALEERTNRIINVLESNDHINIVELVVGSNTHYKFIFGVSFIHRYSHLKFSEKTAEELSTLSKRHHTSLGNRFLIDYVIILNNLGHSIDQIMRIAEDSPDFATFNDRLVDHLINTEPAISVLNGISNYLVLSHLTRGIAIDYKETPPNLCENAKIINANVEMLRNQGYFIYYFDEHTSPENYIKDVNYILYDVNSDTTTMCIRKPDGLHSKEIFLNHGVGHALSRLENDPYHNFLIEKFSPNQG